MSYTWLDLGICNNRKIHVKVALLVEMILYMKKALLGILRTLLYHFTFKSDIPLLGVLCTDGPT